MTKAEYENLTGTTVSDNEYTCTELVYMATDMPKEAFCRMWMNANGQTRDYMWDMARRHKVSVEKKNAVIKGLRDELAKAKEASDDLLDDLFNLSFEVGCVTDAKAILLLYWKLDQYIAKKIMNELPLTKEEQCYVVDRLNGVEPPM